MSQVRIKMGPNAGQVFKIAEQPLPMGREAEEGIVIRDKGVSRRHAEIFRVGEMFFIRDLGSTNGTLLNEELVTEALLHNGDSIQVGSTTLVFEDLRGELEDIKKQVEYEAPEEEELKDASTIELRLDAAAEAESPVESVGEERESKSLATMYRVAKIVGEARREKELLGNILRVSVEATGADGGYVFMPDRQGRLAPLAAVEDEKAKGTTKVSRTILKRALQSSRSILSSDAMLDSRFAGSDSIVMGNIKSVICAPVLSMDRAVGALYLHQTKSVGSFQAEDLELATAIAIQAGAAIASVAAQEKARRSLANTIQTLVTAQEMKDPATQGHSLRVARYSVVIAGELGLPRTVSSRLHLAGLLHDVGKILSPPEPLPGQDKLTWRAEHVRAGERLLRRIPGLEELGPAVRAHHEALDGSGFPDGRAGDDIPLEGKLVAAANVFDNMLTRGGLGGEGIPVRQALLEMGRQAGKLYDASVVEALLAANRAGTLFQADTST